MRIRSYVAIPEKNFCNLEVGEFFLDVSDVKVFVKVSDSNDITNAYDIIGRSLEMFEANEMVRPVEVTLTVERPSILEPVEVCYGENFR